MVTTTDIIIEESVLLGQEGASNAKNEAPSIATSDNARSESEDESIGDDSSCISNSSSSDIDESSLYSIHDTYKADLYEWKNDFTEKSSQKKHIMEFSLFAN